MKPFALLVPSLCLFTALAAQDTAAPSRAQNEDSPRHVIGIDVFPTPGKPFSGRDCLDDTLHIQMGSDKTDHLDGSLVVRDSQGRVYREIRRWFPTSSGPRSRLDYIILLDPVAHTRTECKVTARSCTIAGLDPPSSIRPSPGSQFDTAPFYLHSVSLGSNIIEGVPVEGTRITSSLDAGVFVNNEAPVASLDFWHSPDLGIDFSVIRTYKDGSAKVIHLVDLSRSEPDSSLFKPPQGYAVEHQRFSARVEH